jgi:hypothetical protein
MALLPLRRKSCYGFLSPLKIPRIRPGLNLWTLVPMSSTLTTRPPTATCNWRLLQTHIILFPATDCSNRKDSQHLSFTRIILRDDRWRIRPWSHHSPLWRNLPWLPSVHTHTHTCCTAQRHFMECGMDVYHSSQTKTVLSLLTMDETNVRIDHTRICEEQYGRYPESPAMTSSVW